MTHHDLITRMIKSKSNVLVPPTDPTPLLVSALNNDDKDDASDFVVDSDLDDSHLPDDLSNISEGKIKVVS